MRRTLLVLPLAALVLAGCPGDRRTDESQNSPPKTSTSPQNPKAVPQNSSTMNPIVPVDTSMPTSRIGGAAEAPTIDVQLTEFEIRMPDTMPAGRHRLKIANAGKQNHNFVIEGPGVSQKLTSDLTRGDTTEIAINLAPGQYTVYCPVDGHRGRGMERTLTVR